MGRLTTHVLDTAKGQPGQGITIEVFRLTRNERQHLSTVVTNSDGRCDAPILEGDALTAGSMSWCSMPATTCVPKAVRLMSRAFRRYPAAFWRR
ncbi:hypothetical protein HORIV_54020 [Vreelandella olivaria]|uniref:Transthyretin/hydroxyisourate hydrolase domain-containing protein n=1 Tax=Vreelandella olivaria TaxID=390919 RepID=A0ABN5X8C7_9GAMM|nr:hypothetical protein HORIV_54020 [Halomonas olivaria]